MFFRLLLIAVLLAVSACSSKAPGPGASVPKVMRGEYRVKRGDTLYSIATRHGWNYKDLARANGIRPPYAVRQSIGRVENDLAEPGLLLLPHLVVNGVFGHAQ